MSLRTINNFYAEINEQCKTDNVGYFLPLWAKAKIGNNIEAVGTLTLVTLNGKNYAITASHCFDFYNDFYYLICIGSDAYYINISFFTAIKYHENFDISYAKWEDLGLKSENQKFLDVSNISFNDITHYCILGFPVSKTKYLNGVLQSQIASYGCSVHTEYSASSEELSKVSLLNSDYPNHLFFRYQKQASNGIVKMNAFDLRGMSGGGLFGFHGNILLRTENVKPSLYGILIEKQKNQGMEIGIATKLETIIDLIIKAEER